MPRKTAPQGLTRLGLDPSGRVLYNIYNSGDPTPLEGMMSGKRTFGDFFRELRAERRLSLREFCSNNGFDPGNISKLERGLLPPPQSEEKLSEYAKALRLKQGSDEWYEFFDLAAATNGQIPADVLSDKELVSKLPVFFRTLRRQKTPDKKLNELAEKIRRA